MSNETAIAVINQRLKVVETNVADCVTEKTHAAEFGAVMKQYETLSDTVSSINQDAKERHSKLEKLVLTVLGVLLINLLGAVTYYVTRGP